MKGKFSMLRALMLFGGGLSIVLVTILLLNFALAKNEQGTIIQAVQNAQTSGSSATPGEGKVLRRQDLGAWNYQITEAIDGLGIHIDYRDASVSNLKAYMEANRALLPEVVRLGGRAEIAITFAPALSPDEFRTWAKSKGMQATLVELRTSAPGSKGRGTIGIVATVDDPLPQDRLVAHRTPIQGVFTVRGTVDAKRLAEIVADPQVFLLDVTPAWVRNDVAQVGLSGRLRSRAVVKSPFWQMEELGLQNFTKIALPTIPPPILTVVPIQLTVAPDDWIEETHVPHP